MIEVRGVSKRFGSQQVLHEIDLDIDRGQSVALIGPNGSGKTTLIKIILGLVKANAGTVRVKGRDIREGPGYRKSIGYMPQLNTFPEHMRVRELFRLMDKVRGGYPDSDKDMSLFHDFGLENLIDKPLGKLSGGMRQHVSASLAFCYDPEIFVLDEPTAALDPNSNEILKAKIRESYQNGKSVVVTSHIISDLEEICDHVIYLVDGQIVFAGSTTDLGERTSETRLNKMVAKILKSRGDAE